MKWLILLAATILLVGAMDEGDWVNPFLLPVSFPVNGFFAGYLTIASNKALYYVYTPS
jgi:hypothetical protein